MKVGNGDIASVLPERKDLVFFAAGVSNSQETRETEYEREQDLLLKQHPKSHIVYFSSLAIFYSTTRYTLHKRDMESLVKHAFEHWTIIRLGNITWGKNPNTLINYLKNHKDAKIQNVYRYIIDKDEFLHWINLIPSWNVEMNCPGRRMKIIDIVKEINGGIL